MVGRTMAPGSAGALRALRALLLVLGLLLLGDRTARAEPSAQDRAAAETLFSEAGASYQKGRYPEACAKLAESHKLDPAVGTLLNLARCYEKMGRTATAWLTFLDAASAAKRAHQQEREISARQAADALAPSLPRLTVEVARELAGLEIKRDGTVLPVALWNSSAPVDPGEHEIECVAPGKKPWSTRIRAELGKVTTVSIPALDDAPKSVATTESRPGSGDVTADVDIASAASARSSRHVVALVTGGVGIVGLGVGAAFGLAAKADGDAVKQACPASYCDDATIQRNASAHDKATVSTIAFAAGGAALVTGVVLWFTAPAVPTRDSKAAARRGAIAVLPWVDRDGAALSVAGAW
jgi:hypothetical protein